MTTPLDEGQNPDDLGDRPAVDLGDYPEFFAYGGARGADAKPAAGGPQPGSYQGYEDYFRRPPEPEPPVRSRSAGSADGEAGEFDEAGEFGEAGSGAAGERALAGEARDGGSLTAAGAPGVGSAANGPGADGPAGLGFPWDAQGDSRSPQGADVRGGVADRVGPADPAGNFTPGGAASAPFAANPYAEDPYGADPFAAYVAERFGPDPAVSEPAAPSAQGDEPPLRSRRGQPAAETPGSGRIPRLRRAPGAASANTAHTAHTAHTADAGTTGSEPVTARAADETASRPRSRQVPAPRVEPDHSSFGPAAWDNALAGTEAPTHVPFAEQPPAAPLYDRAAPPHPDTRIPFAEPPAPDARTAFAEPTTAAPPPRPDTRIPFADEPAAAPDYDYRATPPAAAFPAAPAPEYDYRAVSPDAAFPAAPAPDYDYRAVPPDTAFSAPPAPDYDYRVTTPPSPSSPRTPDSDFPFPASDRGIGIGTTRTPRAARAAGPDAAGTPAAGEPAAAHRLVQGPGRRRAKRSLASYLWPFRALTTQPLTSTRIRSRSTAATVWRRLKADRLALAGAVTIVVLIGLAVFANVIDAILGVDPTTLHPALIDPILGPHGSFGGMSLDHPLGVDPSLGRDVLARLLSGARVSLLVAFSSTLLAVGVGSALGVIAGYVGGRVDSVITRLADLFLAFPLFLFALGLTGALSDRAFGLSGNGLRIAVMVFVMGFFNWPYIARIVRAEVLSLREREFIDAARALGARRRWIIGRELMPNLLSPILVYATLLIPTNIIFEAGLSALGIGLNPPAASWGQMMLDASRTVYTDPAYLIVPGMAVFITVLAFNLFGDGLRDALDPTAQ